MDETAQEIREAFAGRPYPGDDRIARRQPGCRGSEAEETWNLFRGKEWQEMIPIGRKVNLGEHVPFLTFEGFAYYLPALLTLALRVEDLRAPDEELVFHLWSYPEEIAALLRPSEKKILVQVLELLAREYAQRNYVRNDAQTALDHYWAYFTDDELGRNRHVQK